MTPTPDLKPIADTEWIRAIIESAIVGHCRGGDLWLSSHLAAVKIAEEQAHLLRAADESATAYAAANAAEKEPRTITQETIHAMREAAGYRPWRLSDDEVAAMARVAIAWVVSDEPTQHMIEEGVKSLRCDLDLTRRPQTRTAQRAARNLYVTMRAASLAPTHEGGGNAN